MKHPSKKTMKVLILEAESPDGTPSRLKAVFSDPSYYNNPECLYRVDHALSAPYGAEGFHLFQKHHPDLVLIDLDHGGDAACQFCHDVRRTEKDRHTGIVFFSQQMQNNDNVLEKVLLHGADDFVDGKASDRELVARVNSVFRFKVMADRLRQVNHRLKTLSLTDELTGLSNMRAFNIDYQKLLKTCQHGNIGLGVIMLDLDHFKSINDSSSHLVGSYVIGEIGRLIAHSGVLGKGAAVARFGGDEYVICVSAESVGIVWAMAERIQDLIMRSVFKKEHYTIKLTGSLGLGWVDPGFAGKSDDLIKAADVMLYRSKRLGRNMVSGMILRYPVDFNHIGRPHLVDRDSCGDDDNIPRLHNA